MVAVLDDEDDAAAAISHCLSLQQLRAIAFTDEEQLLAALARHRIDAFVLDWQLGRETSASLVRALRADPETAAAPIFILTGTLSIGGRPLDRHLVSAIEAFQLLFRPKPWSCAKLARDIRSAVAADYRRCT